MRAVRAYLPSFSPHARMENWKMGVGGNFSFVLRQKKGSRTEYRELTLQNGKVLAKFFASNCVACSMWWTKVWSYYFRGSPCSAGARRKT